MANCYLLEADQKQTDIPRRIKRSGGHSLVNRGLAVWVRKNVLLQLLPASALHSPILFLHPPPYSAHSLNTRPYIPEKLPANIDYKLGLVVQAPILANQIRFRPIAEQGL